MSHNYTVRYGGVMRCCLDRAIDHPNESQCWPADPNEGDTLSCPHGCKSRLIFWDGAFEWFRPDHPAREEVEG